MQHEETERYPYTKSYPKVNSSSWSNSLHKPNYSTRRPNYSPGLSVPSTSVSMHQLKAIKNMPPSALKDSCRTEKHRKMRIIITIKSKTRRKRTKERQNHREYKITANLARLKMELPVTVKIRTQILLIVKIFSVKWKESQEMLLLLWFSSKERWLKISRTQLPALRVCLLESVKEKAK